VYLLLEILSGLTDGGQLQIVLLQGIPVLMLVIGFWIPGKVEGYTQAREGDGYLGKHAVEARGRDSLTSRRLHLPEIH